MKFQSKTQLSLFVAIIFCLPTSFASTVNSQVVYKSEPQRLNLSIQTSGVYLNNDRDTLNGLDFAGIINYGLDKKWAVTMGIRQAFLATDFSTLYTSLSVGMSYSPSLLMQKDHNLVSLGFDQTIEGTTHSRSGWIYGVSLNQYFFNGTNNVYPLVGPELNLKYQLSSSNKWQHQFGASVNYLQNGRESALVGRIFWDLGFWL